MKHAPILILSFWLLTVLLMLSCAADSSPLPVVVSDNAWFVGAWSGVGYELIVDSVSKDGTRLLIDGNKVDVVTIQVDSHQIAAGAVSSMLVVLFEVDSNATAEIRFTAGKVEGEELLWTWCQRPEDALQKEPRRIYLKRTEGYKNSADQQSDEDKTENLTDH